MKTKFGLKEEGVLEGIERVQNINRLRRDKIEKTGLLESLGKPQVTLELFRSLPPTQDADPCIAKEYLR